MHTTTMTIYKCKSVAVMNECQDDDDEDDDDDGDDDDDDNGGVECDPPHHSHHPIGIANRHSTTCLTEVKTALACAAVKAIA